MFHCIDDARALAQRRLPRIIFDYIDGAAGSENGAQQNRSAFEHIALQPRVLRNVEQRTLTSSILGLETDLPFGIAPMGMCNLAWPGADQTLANAASRQRIPHCVSTAASSTLESIRNIAGDYAWFQLYVGQSIESSLEMVQRAADAGYSHLLLTVDVPVVGRRMRELNSNFSYPFRMNARQFMDFALHPRWSLGSLLAGVPKPANFEAGPGKAGFQRNAGRSAADWGFLERLREKWSGKLIVKGVLSCEDAQRIKAVGADGIYVSNHGGRQLDSAPTSIGILPHMRRALGTEYPLIIDSGIRCGESIIKALALGANFVMLGRPMLYALGAGGAKGLDTMLDVLRAEISIAMAQMGCRSINEIDQRILCETM